VVIWNKLKSLALLRYWNIDRKWLQFISRAIVMNEKWKHNFWFSRAVKQCKYHRINSSFGVFGNRMEWMRVFKKILHFILLYLGDVLITHCELKNNSYRISYLFWAYQNILLKKNISLPIFKKTTCWSFSFYTK
jgi:hypothetical protein